MYPKELCDAIVKVVTKQKVMDAANMVDTGLMGKRGLSSFASGIAASIRRER